MVVLALHLIAAAAWFGGLIFLGVAAGVARATVPERERVAFFRALGRRFLAVAAAAAAVLAATGADLVDDRFGSWEAVTDTADGHLVVAKTILFTLALGLAVVHSFALGPRIRRLRERLLEAPGDEAARNALRLTAAVSGVASLVMLAATVAIFVLAADLGR